MTTVSTAEATDPFTELPGWVVAGLAIVFGAIGISYVVTQPESPVPWTFEFALGVIPPVVLLYAGYRMTRFEFPLADEWHLLRACLIGGVSVGAIALCYVVHAILVGAVRPDLFVLVSASIATGGVVGLVASIARLIVESEASDPSKTGSNDRSRPRERDRNRNRESSDHSSRSNAPTPLSPTGRTLGELLADRERWYVVERVSRSERPISVADFSRELADFTGSSTVRRRVRLRHVTLPALEREGLVVVNPRTETVEEGPELEAVRTGVAEVQWALASIDADRDP